MLYGETTANYPPPPAHVYWLQREPSSHVEAAVSGLLRRYKSASFVDLQASPLRQHCYERDGVSTSFSGQTLAISPKEEGITFAPTSFVPRVFLSDERSAAIAAKSRVAEHLPLLAFLAGAILKANGHVIVTVESDEDGGSEYLLAQIPVASAGDSVGGNRRQFLEQWVRKVPPDVRSAITIDTLPID